MLCYLAENVKGSKIVLCQLEHNDLVKQIIGFFHVIIVSLLQNLITHVYSGVGPRPCAPKHVPLNQA